MLCGLLIGDGWAVDRLDVLVALAHYSGHDVLLHLELQTTVVSQQGGVLPFLVLCGHQRGIASHGAALLRRVVHVVRLSLTNLTLLGHDYHRISVDLAFEDLVLQSLSGRYSLLGVLLQHFLQKVQP